MNAPVVGNPRMRSYLAHASQFASGAENPRDFLEACLANLNTWEPKVGAFVNLNIEGARQAADRATARWRAGAPLSPIERRQRRRSAAGRRRDPGQDRHH